MELDSNGNCKKLPPEKDCGNIEYKLKIVKKTKERIRQLATQMRYRLIEGKGNAIYEIGVSDNGIPTGITDDEMCETLNNLNIMASEIEAKLLVLKQGVGLNGKVSEILVKMDFDDSYRELIFLL